MEGLPAAVGNLAADEDEEQEYGEDDCQDDE